MHDGVGDEGEQVRTDILKYKCVEVRLPDQAKDADNVGVVEAGKAARFSLDHVLTLTGDLQSDTAANKNTSYNSNRPVLEI